MDDYISRAAAIEALCCDCSATGDCRPGERCVDYMRIKATPAADVRPDVTAEWVEEDDGYDRFYYSCSACDASVCTDDGDPVDFGWNYCPECGARMIGIRRLPDKNWWEDDDEVPTEEAPADSGRLPCRS